MKLVSILRTKFATIFLASFALSSLGMLQYIRIA